MKKLLAAMRRAPRRTAGILMVAAAVIVPAALWAWGPSDRPTYTYEEPAPHVTFNSITDHPYIGDERNFVRIRDVDAEGNFSGGDMELSVGNTYEVMVFYHNNARSSLNGENYDGPGVAQNAMARVDMPRTVSAGDAARITGFVSADNAQPREVWDEVYATSDEDVLLRYVPDSAHIASSNGAVNGAQLNAENFFGDGVQLGYNQLDGKLPGCNQYLGYITFRFVVDQPDFEVDKKVSPDGGDTWVDGPVEFAPGEEVEYRLHYKNTGTTRQDGVILRDYLPEGMEYVPGSSYLSNSSTNHQWQSVDDGIAGNGFRIGSHNPGGATYFAFKATAPTEDELECGRNVLRNTVTAYTGDGDKSDTADIIVNRECEPLYRCDALTVTRINRTTFEFSTDYTVEHAEFQDVLYTVTPRIMAPGGEVEPIYSGTDNRVTIEEPGEYTVQAYVRVMVDGELRTATSAACRDTITVAEPKTPGVAIEKTVNGKQHEQVRVNEEFNYELVVRNTGDVDLTDVRVTDVQPENIEFLRASEGTIADGQWTHTIAELPVGESASFTIVARVIAEVDGKIVNIACVDAPQVPGAPDDCDDATVEVPKQPTPPAPEVPEELPVTGLSEGTLAIVGLGSLVAAGAYYITSRRALGQL